MFNTIAQLVGLSALWGASFLFLRVASPALGPEVLAATRVVLATAALALLMRVLAHAWPWRHWRELLWIALASVALPFLLFSWAALHIPSGYSAVINTSYIAFGCVFSAWMGLEAWSVRKLAGCVIGMLGVALVVGLGPVQTTPTVWLAALACLLAAVCYGISAPLMKRAVSHMEPLGIAAGIHLWSVLLLVPLALPRLQQAQWTLAATLALLTLGIVTSGLAFWLHLRLMRHLTPTASMTPAFMIPVFGVAWGHLFLGEPLSWPMLIGVLLVLVATALVLELRFPQKRPEQPVP